MSENLPRKPPAGRQDFQVAVVCALPLEADMVEMILDKDWADDGVRYGKAIGDLNKYTTGVIAGINVVLAYCHTIGGNSAAQVATGLRSSFIGIKIAFVVGVCGIVPFDTEKEIVLGDCVISTAVVQFDLGRKGPSGFEAKNGLDALGRVGMEIGTLLTKLQGRRSRLRLTKNLISHLHVLQEEDARTKYPGSEEDHLYQSLYIHSHRSANETCTDCNAVTGICGRDCTELVCEDRYLVTRDRISTSPYIHFGRFGSSNTVLKCGAERDAVAKANKIIAFEMEGSGVWDIHPTVVIKAACDYADSHKNKKWQPYSAAVAASGLKAFLQELEFPDVEGASIETLIEPMTLRPTYSNNNNTNDFSNSMNHGVQANTVYGGIHHHHGPTSTVISQQAMLDSHRITDTISRADAVIRNYYESSDRLKIERLSGDMLPLENCYINLGLVDKVNAKQSQIDDLSFSLEKRLNLKASDGKQITLDELFTPRKLSNGTIIEPRRLFIEGRAGVGKTTLCKKIVHEFLYHNLGGKLFDRLLWVPLRKLESKPGLGRYDWRNFIEDAYSPQDDNWDELASAMSKQLYDKVYLSKTLFLFDGLDEISHGWKPNDPMYERLQTIMCDVPNLIVTSRPQAKSFNIGKFDLELETLGFTPNQVVAYLDKCIGDAETISKIKTLIAQKPLIQGLMRIPIQLDAFCCVWPDEAVSNADQPGQADQELSNIPTYGNLSTMTTLYQSIVSKLFRKDVERLKKSEQIRGLGDTRIGRLLQEERGALEEFAYQGLANGIAIFSPRQVNTIEPYLFYKGNQSIVCEISSLEKLSFLRTSDIKQDQSRKNYHFLHLTFQEFFAAEHFVRHWRTNTHLTRFNLTTLSGENVDKTSPLEFLRHEKYNPQLNIFWRFVVGLMQLQPDEEVKLIDLNRSSEHRNNQDILTFFAQLHSKPVDMLRSAHMRLLTSCLSEVVPGQEQEVEKLRKKEEDRLRKKLIQEKHVNSYVSVGHWIEFPESILCDLLQCEAHLPYALKLLASRDTITPETLEIVSGKLASNFSTDIRFGASSVINKHWRTCPQNIRIMNTTFLIVMLRDKDGHIRREVGLKLHNCLYLPEEKIILLATILGHKDHKANGHIASVLVRCWPVTKNVANLSISTLITILARAHSYQGVSQYFVPINGVPLSDEVITALIAALKDEDDEVRNYAASSLEWQQRRLPREAVATLMTMLRDDNTSVCLCAAKVLRVQLLLLEEVINALVIMLREDHKVQGFAAGVLLSQPSLPQQLSVSSVVSLTAMLRDKTLTARKFAAKVLKDRSSLPQETIDALITVLKDRHDNDLANDVILALTGQSSLPQESTNTLVAMLNDKHNKTLYIGAALVLGKQSSLSQEVINTLVAFLEDWSSRWFYPYSVSYLRLRTWTVKALASQPSLPEEVINVLTVMAGVEKLCTPHDEERISFILRKQSSLSRHTITTLIAALKKNCGRHLYRVLHRHKIYSNIADLDDGAWQQLFSYWLVSGVCISDSISCYDLDGSLYIWSGATSYKYPASSPRTQELIEIARDVIKQQQETETTSNSDE